MSSYVPVNPPGEEEPCGIEGCGRAVLPYGDDVECGLSKLLRGAGLPFEERPECGTTRTVDKWMAEWGWDGSGVITKGEG